jgi:DNA-binding transcriptional regulator YiaG
MGAILHPTRRASLLLRTENGLRPSVKADLRKPEMDGYRALLGAAIKRARLRQEWSLKELAATLARDERQVARWEDGTERAHWDALFAIDGYRLELIVALAELGGAAVEVDTVVRVKRERRMKESAL